MTPSRVVGCVCVMPLRFAATARSAANKKLGPVAAAGPQGLSVKLNWENATYLLQAGCSLTHT